MATATKTTTKTPATRTANQTTTKAPRATRVLGYIRVSTDKQADAGVSLDAQRAKLELYAQLHELTLIGVIVDAGASAKTLDRPGLTQALALLAMREADGLLVAKLDRLTRSVRDLGALIESHFKPGAAALLSVAEQIDTRSAAGRLVLNVLTSVAQWEREAISERTSTALQHMAAEGYYTGGRAPYGYEVACDGETVVKNADEQAVIRTIRGLAAEGMSVRKIAAELAARGTVGRTGKALSHTQVHRVLTGNEGLDGMVDGSQAQSVEMAMSAAAE